MTNPPWAAKACAAAVKEWHVSVPGKRPWTRAVAAAYFTIEHGHLVFKNHGDNYPTYPTVVHVFAPGQWTEVKNGET